MPVRKVMLFLLDHAGGTLEGGYGESGGMPTIAVNIAGSNSQLVDAFRQRAVRPIVHGGGSVLDQQLIRRVEPDHCYAVPLVHDRRTVGVLALGVSGGQPFPGAGKAFLFDLLRQQIADALQNLREATTTGGAAAPDDDLRQQLREAIHEASNPLSIIRNYLDVLRMRIGDQALACSEIALIGEEIDRIGSILLRLRETGDDSASEKLQDISEVIGGVADIFRTTLCATRRVELSVDLPSRALVVRTRVGHLKQVLVNLLKNAVEALPEGGSIGLSAASVYAESGTRWVEITVSDDGPGLPDPVMMQLFQPMKSTKGEGHSGLGLSITKKLIDQLGGRLTCKTGTSGTRFQVLLPSSETVQS
jgi:signal transduction histidine kinase